MFKEYANVVEKLKEEDKHFEKLFQKHNDLDKEITDMEKNHSDQFLIEKTKKEKLKLKDEIYNTIINYKKENNL